MQIFSTPNKKYLEQADELLYQVLWQPFGLPRDTRGRFEIDGVEVVFTAVLKEKVIAAFVLINRGEEAEIRHAAVHPEFQRSGVGQEICAQVLDFAKRQGVKQVEVYGRSAAIGFWEKLGFQDTSGWLDHDLFVKYGIRFKKMSRDL